MAADTVSIFGSPFTTQLNVTVSSMQPAGEATVVANTAAPWRAGYPDGWLNSIRST